MELRHGVTYGVTNGVIDVSELHSELLTLRGYVWSYRHDGVTMGVTYRVMGLMVVDLDLDADFTIEKTESKPCHQITYI